MAKTKAFDEHSAEYDNWFVRNEDLYLPELKAVKTFIPQGKYGMEVGIGTGRFALPLGIRTGVEPSEAMAAIARRQGLEVITAVAERLPFGNNSFDFILMVTTICFVDDIRASFREAHRVLRLDGALIVGFVDKDSRLGKKYLRRKDRSKFYGEAVFFGTDEILDILKETGFGAFEIRQTLMDEPGKRYDDVCDGYGSGSFIVIRALKTP
jgi:SAM-dependent methyltransferase